MSSPANLPTSMRIELHDPAGARFVSTQELPLSIGGEAADIAVPGIERDVVVVLIGIDERGLYVEPQKNEASLNGQPLAGRRALAHGDVLNVGDAYIFVLTDGSRIRLQVDRQPGVVTVPPVLEPGESEEMLEPGADAQSIHRVPFRPLLRGRTVRSRHFRRRHLFMIAVILLGLLLWLPANFRKAPEPVPQQVQKIEVQPEPAPSAPAPAPEPQPIVGKLLVRTKPAGADVTIAGLYRGRTPLEIALPPAPEYAIEIHRAGYEPASRVSAVEADERVSLDVTLKPILGQVTVRGEPADAQLFVDGESKGSADQTLSLPAAALQLEVRRDGYQTFTTTVTPQPGFPRVVEYRLLTPEQAQAQRYAPVIKTKIGGELRLMPTGQFQMGSPRREAGSRANESRRTVTLQRQFYLGTKEVTNAEYLHFRSEHLSGVIKDRSLDQDTHPVVNVSWREAAEFCNWLSTQEGLPPAYEQHGEDFALVSPAATGYRLPTEAEWEWAARYEGGQASRRYPWGQGLPVPPASGNYADRSSLTVLEAALEGYDDGFPTTAPVGRFQPNPLGLFDMGGNVSEWVHDFYTVYRELDQGSTTDPTGPASGTNHVIRGSSWKTASVTELRLPWREALDGKAQHIGFRIARYAE